MDCQIALCQIRPTLGDLDRNFSAHHKWLEKAKDHGADLILFPELSLTGYFLRDLVQEVALRLDDPRVENLVAQSKQHSIVFGLVEESDDHRFYNSAVFAEDGEILQVHRKVFLPDYGIFEEGRYFAAGDDFQTVKSKWGKFGLLLCEDAWHAPSAWLHFLQGVDAILIPSSSPARGIDTDQPELSSQHSWKTLTESQGLFLQTWIVHCNRVGFEDGTSFWGGSSVVSPFGFCQAHADGEKEELLVQKIDSPPLRRARMFSPLRRDAKPDFVRRQLAKLLQDPDALAADQNTDSREP
jgi:predicted amidohydrolase